MDTDPHNLRAWYQAVFDLAALHRHCGPAPDELQLPMAAPPAPRLVSVAAWQFDGRLSRPVGVPVPPYLAASDRR